MTDHGIHATGLWEVINNTHEIVMVWATTVDDWVQFQKNRDTTKGLDDSGTVDERITKWEKTAASYILGGDTHIITPLPGTVYGPDKSRLAMTKRRNTRYRKSSCQYYLGSWPNSYIHSLDQGGTIFSPFFVG